MAPRNIFDDPDFKSLPYDQQVEVFKSVEPDFDPQKDAEWFKGMTGGDTSFADTLDALAGAPADIYRELSTPEGRANVVPALRAGVARAGAAVDQDAINALDLVQGLSRRMPPVARNQPLEALLQRGMDALSGRREENLAGAEELMRGREGTTAKVGEVVGGLPTTLGKLALPVKVLGPVKGLFAASALSAEHEGPMRMLVEGAKGGAFGWILKATEAFSPLTRAAAGAVPTYALSSETDPIKRATEAGAMGLLGALPHSEVRRQLDDMASRTSPVERAARPEPDEIPMRELESLGGGGRLATPEEVARSYGEEPGATPPGELDAAPTAEEVVARDNAVGSEDAGLQRGLPSGEPLGGESRGPGGGAEADLGEGARGSGPGEVRQDGEGARGSLAPDDSSVLAARSPVGQAGPNYQGRRDFDPVAAETPLPKKAIDDGQALERLAKALGVPVTQGTLRPFKTIKGVGNVGGWAKVAVGGKGGPRTVRVKKWGDIQTGSHEISHVLDSIYPEFQEWYKGATKPDATPGEIAAAKKIADEVLSVSYDLSKPEEGFAEFNRLWFTQPEKLAEVAPTAKASFETLAPQVMGAKKWKAMQRAQKEMTGYFTQGGRAALRSIFGKPNKANAALDSIGDRFRAGALDRFHGIKMLEEATQGKTGPLWERWSALPRVGQLVEEMWAHGMPEWQKPGDIVELTGEGFEKILAPVSHTAEMLRDFEAYSVARMEGETAGLGLETRTTPELRAAAKKLETPAFRTAFAKLQQANESVVRFAIEGGLIDPAQASNWRRTQYAWGLFREMEMQRKGRPMADPISASSGVYAMRGTSRNLADPLDSILSGPGRIIQLTFENLAKLKMMEALKRKNGGMFGQILPGEAQSVRVHRQAIEGALLAELNRITGGRRTGRTRGPATAQQLWQNLSPNLRPQGGGLAKAGFDEFLHVFTGLEKPFGDNVVTALRGGKPVYAEITDPLLLHAVATMRFPARSWLERFLNSTRRFYQVARTSTLGFAGAQFIRDPIMATMNTKTGLQAFTSSARGYAETLLHRDSPIIAEMRANFGGIGSSRPHSLKARRAALLRAGQRDTGDPARFLNVLNPAAWARTLEAYGEAIEGGPRAGEYMRAKQRGMDIPHAAHLSREITTDFTREGSSPITRLANSTIPFLRAMLSSNELAYRNAFTAPEGRAAYVTKFVTAVGLLSGYYLWMQQQPWAKDENGRSRFSDSYMRIKVPLPPINIGGRVVHPGIPLAYEVGFAWNLTRGALDYFQKLAKDGDPSERKMAEDVLNAVQVNFGVSAPPVVQLAMEQYSNRKAFYDTPIETEGMKGMEGFYRATAGTPRVLRDVAGLQHGLVPPDLQVSAPRMDAALNTILGPNVALALQAIDRVLHPGQIPTPHPEDLPGLSTFLTRADKRSPVPEDFYEFLEAAEQARGTLSEARKRGDLVLRREYREAGARSEGRLADRAQRRVARINAKMVSIREDTELSPHQKTRELDELQAKKLAVMRKALGKHAAREERR